MFNPTVESRLFSSSSGTTKCGTMYISYLRVPGVLEDRVSTTPFVLRGEMVIFLIAVPPPFPEIKTQKLKTIQRLIFRLVHIF